MSLLSYKDILSFGKTCKNFNKISQDDLLWKPLYQRVFTEKAITVISERWNNHAKDNDEKGFCGQINDNEPTPFVCNYGQLATTPVPDFDINKDFISYIAGIPSRIKELEGTDGKVSQAFQKLEDILDAPREKLLGYYNKVIKENMSIADVFDKLSDPSASHTLGFQLRPLERLDENSYYVKEKYGDKYIPLEELFLMHCPSITNPGNIITCCIAETGHTINNVSPFLKNKEITEAKKNYNRVDVEFQMISEINEKGERVFLKKCAAYLNSSPNDLK